MSAEKRARLRNNPVKVRFAEEVVVNGHTQVGKPDLTQNDGCCEPQMNDHQLIHLYLVIFSKLSCCLFLFPQFLI